MNGRLVLQDDRARMNEVDALSTITDILPSQWADRFRKQSGFSPRLAFALIEGACWDLQSGRPKLQHEALAWFTDLGPSVFSFSDACDALGWDADWLRAGILDWAQAVSSGKVARVSRRRPIVERQRVDGERYGSRRRKSA